MRFLRENVFLVALIPVVVVLGGIILFMTHSADSDLQAEVDKRVEVSRQVRALGRASPRVNSEAVAADQKQARAYEVQAEKVAKLVAWWNRDRYSVPRLPISAGTSVPAFPIDESTYRKYGLVFQFSKAYRQSLLEKLNALSITSVPSTEEIQDEQRTWEKRIRLAKEEQRPAAGGRRVPAGPMAMEEMMVPAARRRPVPGRTLAGAVPIKDRARNAIMVKKSMAGLIYADEKAMNMAFQIEVPTAPWTDVWFAQIDWWIKSDILDAIAQTNVQAVEKLGKKAIEAGVPDSAVKRLIEIVVDKGYYTEKVADGGRRPGAAGAGTFGVAEDIVGPGGSRAPRTVTVARKVVPTLTGRVSCRDYDVIHYTFSAVMSARHLLALQDNLMKRNLHVILKVEMSQVKDSEADLYYYGTDPVMQVTFEGELLLLTAWERGTWDKDKGQWCQEFPPLMPREVLENDDQVPLSALRPEDTRRLER